MDIYWNYKLMVPNVRVGLAQKIFIGTHYVIHIGVILDDQVIKNILQLQLHIWLTERSLHRIETEREFALVNGNLTREYLFGTVVTVIFNTKCGFPIGGITGNAFPLQPPIVLFLLEVNWIMIIRLGDSWKGIRE